MRSGNSGTQMERKWNANGTQMEREWNANGTRMEREWNAFRNAFSVRLFLSSTVPTYHLHVLLVTKNCLKQVKIILVIIVKILFQPRILVRILFLYL
jgi:hypothetical protein